MTGIDKIQVWTPLENISIKDAGHILFGRNATTKQGQGDLPPLITDSQGETVHANSIFHNSQIAQYSINRQGLMVQFNPSKAKHPYHLSSTGKGFSATVQAISRELQAIGIKTNLDQMRLCRLDLAKQAEMSQPFGNYIDVFRLLKGKRAKEQRQYPSGYIVGNKTWSTISYDKEQELHEKHHMDIPESNLMRIENRYMKSQAISAQVKVNTLPELSELSPADIDNVYCKHLSTKYFPKQFEGEQIVMGFETIIEQMQSAKKSFGRNWFVKYTSAIGIDTLLMQLGGLEMIRKALTQVEMKQTVSKQMSVLNELLYFKTRLDADTGQNTVASLLLEIQQRFAA